MKNPRLSIILIIVVGLLLIPLIAMQFTDEVNWGIMDFGIAGLLLMCGGVIVDLAYSKLKDSKYRILVVALILIVFGLIWAELAVGIFGSPFAGS